MHYNSGKSSCQKDVHICADVVAETQPQHLALYKKIDSYPTRAEQAVV